MLCSKEHLRLFQPHAPWNSDCRQWSQHQALLPAALRPWLLLTPHPQEGAVGQVWPSQLAELGIRWCETVIEEVDGFIKFVEQGILVSDQGFGNSPCKLFSSLYLYKEPSMFANVLFIFLPCSEDLGTDCSESTCIQIPRRKKSCHCCHVFLFPEAVCYMKVEPSAGHSVVEAYSHVCGLSWHGAVGTASLPFPFPTPGHVPLLRHSEYWCLNTPREAGSLAETFPSLFVVINPALWAFYQMGILL